MAITIYKNLKYTTIKNFNESTLQNDDLTKNEFEKLSETINWSRKSSIKKSSIHSICSYLAMFSHALPNYFIKKYSNIDDIVYDPFSGKGTTILEARLENRKAIASDLNPLAIVLSKSKSSKFDKKEVLKRLNEIEIEFKNEKIEEIDLEYYNSDFSGYYSKNNFLQLLFLKKKIGKNWKNLSDIDNFILAIALGIMHGPMRKNGETIYFSVDMPNTISMAPNYVKNYVAKNNLKLPEDNIFKLIKNRIDSKFDDLLYKSKKSKVFEQDATKKISSKNIKRKSVKLIVTSPPYLSIINYTTSNWLRLWLLGYERKNLKEIKLSDRLNYDSYVIFLKTFLNNMHEIMIKDGKICLVVGDVEGKMTIENIWKIIENDLKNKYIFEELYIDNIDQNKKTTNMLKSKAGKATNIEKVLVLKVI